MSHISWSSDYALYLDDKRNVITWILVVPCDTKADLKIYACQCDLHFMVQCFFPFSLKTF